MPQEFDTEILNPAQDGDWDTLHGNEHDDWAYPQQYDGIKEPTDQQLSSFLDAAAAKRGINHEQRAAIDFIRGVAATITNLPPGSPSKIIAYQTALRAVDPDSIWQGIYGFCGPAAIAYNFAKNFPLQYAQCIVSLQNNGVSSMEHNARAFNLNADPQWSTYYWSARAQAKIGPADFLILHAIRRAAEYGVHSFDITNPGQASDATPPDKMKQFLQDAGYLNVIDRTFGWNQFAGATIENDIRGLVYSQELAALTRQVNGPLVIMLVHHTFAEAARDATAWDHFARAGRLDDLHWICVNSFTQLPSSDYQMSFMSWGTRCTGTYTELQFRSCFYGYISAVP